ncbi:mannitol-1-phosphate 5-dehydrogenase [Mycoplasmoides pneumoniae]|uniref:Mannitol-1-phosphate 5-dehydrogenase n=1 Tax=Mycoplasmoides pneumoniae 309 TaxID=1112856 RepID=A0AB33HPG0_MYCPM|nr:mannitol-1-phosphate 5-dehydrogenase [Mycoplasmoides pneumoniae]BAL22239.1 mannitol-1-phosphate 5-dehydrogenase [Mycoplasmoides pneumoniae 309]
MKRINVLHFGAGNIGRGVILPIYQQNDFSIDLVELNQNTVNELQKQKQYQVHYLDCDQSQLVNDFNTWNLKDETKIIELMERADVISTSIGAKNLASLKTLFDKAKFHKRAIVLCFENGFRISSNFKNILQLNNTQVNFVDVVIDTIAPNFEKKANFLDIYCEKYSEIYAETFPLEIKGVNQTNSLDRFIIKKLLLVNALHSVIGLLGFQQKLKYVHETLQVKSNLTFVEKLAQQIIDALCAEYPEFNKNNLLSYGKNNLVRFANPKIQDLNTRLIREPLRKLNQNERFYAIYKLFKKNKIALNNILQVYLMVLKTNITDDTESQQIAKLINEKAWTELAKLSSLEESEWNLIKQELSREITKK